MRSAPLLLALALAAACRSAVVSPATIRAADVPAEERAAALAALEQGVVLANEFLASPYRLTLPPGRFELDDDGMRFVTAGGERPIEVRCTTWGDLCVGFGFAAQERSWGFVVGAREPARDRRVDNTLLRDSDGEVKSPADVAELTLHETTHVVYGDGTVGFWNGVAYYLEAVFLFRYSKHSAERRPFATSHEFGYFRFERDSRPENRGFVREAFLEHLAEPSKRCRHGELPPGAFAAERTPPGSLEQERPVGDAREEVP